MPYRITVKNIEVICDSAEEALEIVKKASNAGQQTTKAKHSRDGSKSSLGVVYSDDIVLHFYKLLKPGQRKIIDALVSNPKGQTDAQLLSVAGVTDAKGLGGVLSGVGKNARKAGLDKSNLLERSINRKGQRHYGLNKAFRDQFASIRMMT